jgi:hypothetical protein
MKGIFNAELLANGARAGHLCGLSLQPDRGPLDTLVKYFAFNQGDKHHE